MSETVEAGDYILCDASIMQEGYILAKVVKSAPLGKQWTIIPIRCVLNKAIVDEEKVCRRKLTKVIKLDIDSFNNDALVNVWVYKNDVLTYLNRDIANLKKQYHTMIKEVGQEL